MTEYDDFFDATRPDGSIFAETGALDPVTNPAKIIARESQERQLVTLSNGVHEGYLPTTVSIYGPPGTDKTITARRVRQAFAARIEIVSVEYANCYRYSDSHFCWVRLELSIK